MGAMLKLQVNICFAEGLHNTQPQSDVVPLALDTGPCFISGKQQVVYLTEESFYASMLQCLGQLIALIQPSLSGDTNHQAPSPAPLSL